MLTAALAIYGSRTTIIFYNTNTNSVEEYTLRLQNSDNEESAFWEKTKDKIKIAK